jgi:hypothetical protein
MLEDMKAVLRSRSWERNTTANLGSKKKEYLKHEGDDDGEDEKNLWIFHYEVEVFHSGMCSDCSVLEYMTP